MYLLAKTFIPHYFCPSKYYLSKRSSSILMFSRKVASCLPAHKFLLLSAPAANYECSRYCNFIVLPLLDMIIYSTHASGSVTVSQLLPRKWSSPNYIFIIDISPECIIIFPTTYSISPFGSLVCISNVVRCLQPIWFSSKSVTSQASHLITLQHYPSSHRTLEPTSTLLFHSCQKCDPAINPITSVLPNRQQMPLSTTSMAISWI